MSQFLFSEFDPISAKQWKQKIQVDLKGADYHASVLTSTNEGITINPFYHPDGVTKRFSQPKLAEASLAQAIFVSSEKTANHLAKDALERGADAIIFEANEAFDIEPLVEGITGTIRFKLNFWDASFYVQLIEKTKGQKTYIALDVLGSYMKTGNWNADVRADMQGMKALLSQASATQCLLSIGGDLYQNAGANCVQQLAYTLAHLNEYLCEFVEDLNGKTLELQLAVGGHYFMEIAKLRAMRVLVDCLIKEYDLGITVEIFAQPSLRNKTLYDYNVNMLRTTTECMSALLGGCNTIANVSYDALFHKKNEFGERIARNQIIILKEESYFKKAAQIANGSYYIERLTEELAQKALNLFKSIEKSGGLLHQLAEGTIQRKIKESAQKEQAQFDAGDLILLGTNKHPNLKDRMQDEIALYPFVKTQKRSTKIEPIIPRRLAEKMEQERLAKEKS